MHSGGPRRCVHLSTGGCVRPPVFCENMSRQAIVNFTGSGRGGGEEKKKLIKSLSASSASCIYTIYAERKWKAFKGSGVSDTMRYREGDITGRKFFVSLLETLETGVQTFPSEYYAWLYFLTFLPLSESRVCLCSRMLVFPQVRPQNDSMF